MSERRRWAWPLVPLYGAALATRDALRAAGLRPERRLAWPVISVGSVSAGGAGKTPLVIALAHLLTERGWLVDVLSRGYGRSGTGTERVQLEREDAARRFGDEPVVIAERTGVPVWVGASRYEAGRSAERRDMPQPSTPPIWQEAEGWGGEHPVPICAHILDDGFQHRSLARQFDLVLVTEKDVNDTLLPAGNLREPLSALRRASAFAVREEELEAVSERLRRLAAPEIPIWTVRRSLRFPAPLGVFSAGLRPLAFCGVARPEDFAAMLGTAGCGVVDTVVFPDHHRYREDDLALLARLARQLEATGLVTTEKDAVKLSPAMRAELEQQVGPLMVVRLDAQFLYEAPVVRALEGKLRPTVTSMEYMEARAR